MKQVRVVIEGETYLSLEAIAECYACEVQWLREVYSYGLLGPGRMVGQEIVVAAWQLDRAAEIVRLGVHLGVSPSVIALLLGPESEWEEA